MKLKTALADTEEALREYAEREGLAEEDILFAFTATPKATTLEMFGQEQEDGSFQLDNVKASAGGLNEAQIVETVLYEMTIARLEDYLFKPYSGLEKKPELEEFNKVDINELSEIEKANWLKIMQKRSLWDDVL